MPTDRGENDHLALLSTLGTEHLDTERVTNALADLVGEDLPTEIYLRILTHGVTSHTDLASQGYSPEALDATLTILLARGMVRRNSEGWRVTPPAHSLPALAGQLEARATNIRAALPGLVAVYRNAAPAATPAGGIEGTETLTGTNEVAFAFAQCIAASRREAKAMRVHSMTTRDATFDAIPGSRTSGPSPTGRDISVRTVIDTTLVAGYTREDFDAFQHAPNVHVRLATGVPFTAAVNDCGLAVVETFLDGRIDGVLVRDPGLVAAVEATIDLMLRVSSPLRPTSNDVDAVTQEERVILSLLAAGVPDATVARRIGVSPRTVDRRIRSLMDRLSATTRFQTGALAERRGWL